MKKLPFVKAADVEGEFRNPPRTSKLLLAPKFGGVKNLSMGMNVTEVDSMIPDHTHEESEEVLFLKLLEKLGFEQWAYLPRVLDFDGEEFGEYYYGIRVEQTMG